jgi:methionyl-tRNA formyltransferase
LFFGTSEFAVPILRAVAELTDLAGVVTQPDRPAGRGHKLVASPVKVAALELGLRVYEPERLKPFAEELARDGAFDLFALASYGRILPQALLDLPKLGALNVHPSLLPRYRGATPIQTAIRDGQTQTGVSVMLMDAGMDTGDLVLQETAAIEPADDYGTLHDRLAVQGAGLLARAIVQAGQGPLARAPQRGQASVTSPIRKEDLVIDWTRPPDVIVNHIRAYAPQPAARGLLYGETVKLLRAHVAPDGALAVDELIAPNRGRMSEAAYRQSRAASTS